MISADCKSVIGLESTVGFTGCRNSPDWEAKNMQLPLFLHTFLCLNGQALVSMQWQSYSALVVFAFFFNTKALVKVFRFYFHCTKFSHCHHYLQELHQQMALYLHLSWTYLKYFFVLKVLGILDTINPSVLMACVFSITFNL